MLNPSIKAIQKDFNTLYPHNLLILIYYSIFHNVFLSNDKVTYAIVKLSLKNIIILL